jgi:tetratricopeptide (TPR) repeat protein
MRILFVLAALSISLSFNLQAFQTIDSAALKINNYKKQDTIKVEMLIDYCVSNTFSVSKQMLDYANQAYQLSKKLNYNLGQIRALNCTGNYYYQQAKYDVAIKYYTQAMALAEKLNDNKNIVIGKSNLASIYSRTKQPQKALKMFTDADSILVSSGAEASQNRAAILTNTGMVYSSIGQHQQAVKLHLKVLEISQKLNIPFGIAISKSNIGEEYVYLNKPSTAIIYLEEAKQVCLKNSFTNLLPSVYKGLGKAFEIKNDYTLSVFYLEKAIEISKETNNQNSLLSANQKLYQIYAKNGDFKNAFLTSLSFMSVNDSINGIEKQKTIADINAKYETEKKEAEIEDLNQKKKITDLQSTQKNTLIYSLIAIFITLVIITYVLFSRYKIKQNNQRLNTQLRESEKLLEVQRKVKESELKALKSQMNPHFIFNALNGIQHQFMYGDKFIANEQMSNFTYLTRQILEASGKKSIALSAEIDIITKYLELEKMRFSDDFNYQITINPNIDEEYLKIPPMLLQPFVENSIKHGLLHKSGLKELTIDFQLSPDESQLHVLIIDNGVGRAKSAEIKKQQTIQHNSFSSEAIEQRLALISNQNQEEFIHYTDLFDKNNLPSGTQLLVKIPLS